MNSEPVTIDPASSKVQHPLRLPSIIVAMIGIFLFMSIGGDAFGWMDNDACFRLFGCNIGFWGYDAIVHFMSSSTEVVLMIWFTRSFAKLNWLSNKLWKNVLILTACAGLIGICWELGEFVGDWTRIHWDHINLYIPNHLYQSTNADTNGDLAFGIFGAFVTSWFSDLIRKI